MTKKLIGGTIATIFLVSNAFAQTSTCMSTGGGMTHCDHLGGGWTDCTATGPNMATCNTMAVPEPNNGQASTSNSGFEGIASIVRQAHERSLRKKIGTMLAAGDCEGAARFAFSNGRIELGASIQSFCQPTRSAQVSEISLPLPQVLQRMASRASVPATLDQNAVVRQIRADGNHLSFLISINDKTKFTDQWRVGLLHQFCDPNGFGRLMAQGAEVRSEFEDQQHIPLGVISVNQAQCNQLR